MIWNMHDCPAKSPYGLVKKDSFLKWSVHLTSRHVHVIAFAAQDNYSSYPASFVPCSLDAMLKTSRFSRSS